MQLFITVLQMYYEMKHTNSASTLNTKGNFFGFLQYVKNRTQKSFVKTWNGLVVDALFYE